MSAQLDLYSVVYGSMSELAIKEYEELLAIKEKYQWKPFPDEAAKDAYSIIVYPNVEEWAWHPSWEWHGVAITNEKEPTHYMVLPEEPEETENEQN